MIAESSMGGETLSAVARRLGLTPQHCSRGDGRLCKDASTAHTWTE